MTIETPLWLQNPDYPARLDRALIAMLWDEGVRDLAAFKVTQRGAGANMSVDVTAGEAFVQGDNEPFQGNYLARSTAVENRTVTAAPGSNSRYDLVVLRVNDPTAGGPAGDVAVIEVIAGTPAASPTVPATPSTAIPLARLGPIGVGKVSIVDADILDLRPLAGQVCEPGTLKAWTGAIVPTGWLWADGTLQTRATFARLNALYAAQGYPYGAGNGSTTFGIPNLVGRFPFADDATTTVGATGGSKDATLVTHTHTGPSHTHDMTHTHGIDHDHPSATTSSVAIPHSHTFTTSSNASHGYPVVRQYPSYGTAQYGVPHDPNADGLVIATGGTGAGSTSFGSTMAVGPGESGVHGHTGTTDSASPSHQHSLDVAAYVGNTVSMSTTTTGAGGTGATGSAGSSATGANMPPYQVINGWIVRT